MCATRWVESHHAFVVFKELLVPTLHCLEQLQHQGGDTGAHAHQYSSAVCRCDSITSLFVIESFLSLFLPLSIYLQSKSLDIFSAVESVDNILTVLKRRRENADVEFRTLFGEVTEFCRTSDIDIRKPRICDRQTQRENHPSESTEEYYRVSCYLQYLDNLVEGFGSLFSDLRKEALKIQCLLPAYVITSSFEDLRCALDFYESDLDGCSEGRI